MPTEQIVLWHAIVGQSAVDFNEKFDKWIDYWFCGMWVEWFVAAGRLIVWLVSIGAEEGRDFSEVDAIIIYHSNSAYWQWRIIVGAN